MAFTYAQLTPITTIASSAGAVYTNPSSKTSYIRGIIIHNTNTSAEAVVLYNVPDNSGSVGTAAAANQFYKTSVAADTTVIIEFPVPGLVLSDVNDTIQATTTTASKVTIQISGATE
jgi:hypothetical protein|tara:strand:+ start:551 stop:901 length:351 start_codon:yes stop_codon:yes gene_type:complete